jgi:hypothetical protein
LAIGTAAIASSDEISPEGDRLVRVNTHDVDHLYVLPGADFASYRRIRLDPVDVSFSERWDQNLNRTRTRRRRLSDEDIRTLRSTVATEFERSVADELSRGGYTLVDEDADDVLRVTPMIVNLYITAPRMQTQTPARSRTYIANTGHMTLVASVRDSVTGEYLARVVDTQHGPQTGTVQLAGSAANLADARRAFRNWAQVLRTGLDDARESAVAKDGVAQKQAAKESSATPR